MSPVGWRAVIALLLPSAVFAAAEPDCATLQQRVSEAERARSECVRRGGGCAAEFETLEGARAAASACGKDAASSPSGMATPAATPATPLLTPAAVCEDALARVSQARLSLGTCLSGGGACAEEFASLSSAQALAAPCAAPSPKAAPSPTSTPAVPAPVPTPTPAAATRPPVPDDGPSPLSLAAFQANRFVCAGAGLRTLGSGWKGVDQQAAVSMQGFFGKADSRLAFSSSFAWSGASGAVAGVDVSASMLTFGAGARGLVSPFRAATPYVSAELTLIQVSETRRAGGIERDQSASGAGGTIAVGVLLLRSSRVAAGLEARQTFAGSVKRDRELGLSTTQFVGTVGFGRGRR